MGHDSIKWIQENNPYFTMTPFKPATRLYRHYSPDNYFKPVSPYRSDTKELYEPQPYYK